MAAHRSPAERHDLVTRWLASPLSTHEFAIREGVSASSLHRWRRIADEVESTSSGDAFVEIAVSDLPGACSIEVELGNATIRIPNGCDAATLTTVLDALRAVQ